MYKTILLPVDMSNPASMEPALQQALAIVQASSATLHVVSVVPDFGSAMVGNFFPAEFEAEALKRADDALTSFRNEKISTDLDVRTHLAQGPVAEKILAIAQEVEADLIVMGSHDPDRIRDFLIGTNAERVVRHSTSSVLVARG